MTKAKMKAATVKEPDRTASKKKFASRKGNRGRPTKYSDDLPERLIEYFDVEAFTAEATDSGKVAMTPAKFPTMARFAARVGISRNTLHRWATETDENGDLLKPEFCDAYKRAQDLQEAMLIEGGMAGAFQPSFAIFTAKNVLGWRDKQELEHMNDPLSRLLEKVDGKTRGLPSTRE